MKRTIKTKTWAFMKEDFNYLHFYLSLYLLTDEVFLSSLSLNSGKKPAGQTIGDGNWNNPLRP